MEGQHGEGSPSSRVLLSYDVASSFDGGIRLERDQPLERADDHTARWVRWDFVSSGAEPGGGPSFQLRVVGLTRQTMSMDVALLRAMPSRGSLRVFPLHWRVTQTALGPASVFDG